MKNKNTYWLQALLVIAATIYFFQSSQNLNNRPAWNLKKGKDEFKVLFLPRISSLPEGASDVLGYQVRALGLEEEIIAILSPDSRGHGYGMRRYNDDARMDFSKVEGEADVHFAHSRGFIAKTSAVDKERLQEMLIQSYQS